MKFSLLLTAALAGLVATPAAMAQAKDGVQASIVTAPGQASATRTATVAATVTEVDASKGTVTLKGPKGELFPLKVGPEVRNLAQVKVGDSVNVRYLENLTLTLLKSGKAKVAVNETSKAVRADPGAKPGAAVAEQTEVIADVTAVNAKDKTVTLKGPKQTLDLKVQDPEQLKLIKVGDQVQAVYTQALALSVEPAKK